MAREELSVSEGGSFVNNMETTCVSAYEKIIEKENEIDRVESIKFWLCLLCHFMLCALLCEFLCTIRKALIRMVGVEV